MAGGPEPAVIDFKDMQVFEPSDLNIPALTMAWDFFRTIPASKSSVPYF